MSYKYSFYLPQNAFIYKIRLHRTYF